MPENTLVNHINQTANQDYQKTLAVSLVSSLGLEGAFHTCQSNGWDGVLKWVIVLQKTGEHQTSGV